MFFLYASEQRTTKAAPSCIRHALAAVIIEPPGSKQGSLSKSLWLMEGLIPSSFCCLQWKTGYQIKSLLLPPGQLFYGLTIPRDPFLLW